MNEKEIKKIDEKGEEKISGGTKLDADLIKKIKESHHHSPFAHYIKYILLFSHIASDKFYPYYLSKYLVLIL